MGSWQVSHSKLDLSENLEIYCHSNPTGLYLFCKAMRYRLGIRLKEIEEYKEESFVDHFD